MSLEDYRNSIEPSLILPLAPQSLKPAQFVKTRTSSTWRSSTAEAVSSGGVVRITLTSDIHWLCPETARLMFTVNNLAQRTPSNSAEPTYDSFKIGQLSPAWDATTLHDANQRVFYDLQPAGGAASFISRIRVLVGGQLVEDVNHYGRLHEMLSILEPNDKLLNEGISDFAPIPVGGSFINKSFKQFLTAGESRTVSIKLKALGVFSAIQAIPLRYAPITLEISIAQPEVALAKGDIAIHALNQNHLYGLPQILLTTETPDGDDRCIRRSQSFNLTNWAVKADTMTLDTGIDERFNQLMTDGSWDLTFSTYTTDSTTALAGVENPTLTMSRVLTSIRTVYVTFFEANFADRHVIGTREICNRHYTEANMFSTPKPDERAGMPLGTWGAGSDYGDYEAQLAIGNAIWPDYPMQSMAEMFESLNRAVGTMSIDSSISLKPYEYRTGHRHILAFNLEKAPLYAVLTGVSTRGGELIQVRLNKMTNLDTVLSAGRREITKAFVTLEYDCAVKIRAAGVEVIN